MAPSQPLQKLLDLLILVHNRQDGDLSKVLADAISSKVENIRLSALK